MHWLTTILIFLPVAGALLVVIAPLSQYWLGSIAALVSLIEIGVWITAVGKFDFGSPGLQLGQQVAWIPDLNVSYAVGFYAFSLWLVGMAVIVMAACVIYGWWVGRTRARAYFALMLMLTGAIVGVFTAQDLLLFYAFFEGMLIPLYVLIGVWGGAGRMRATQLFVIYTVVGSLLMLAAIIVYGLQEGTFNLTQMGPSGSTWLFLGFVAAFAVKAPLFPLHGWLPDAYRESVLPPEARYDLMVVSTGTRRMWPIRDVGPLTDEYSLTSDWDNQWLTGGLEPDVIAEAHLDTESIFAGIQRFANERTQRLTRQRTMLGALG